jgi:uncharacterized protein (TIGR00255 family)
MTGYAYREKSGAELSVSVEIRGCNSRYMEIYVNLPPWLSMLEVKIREKISSHCGRGKIEVFVRVRECNAPVNISINKNAARAYLDAINDMAKDLGIKESPNLLSILGLESVLEIEKNHDNERYWQEIEPLLDETVQSFCSDRQREGKHTEDDILSHIGSIESSLKNISSFVPVIEQTLKDNIKTRFVELLGNQIDENRILAETASQLLKYTISEEISRLTSHLAEFRAETEKNQRPGKKLDFLCQEINREINTVGSKSAIIEVTNEVVKMKEALENIREQLRNIE